jgi:hypothetical protein
MVDIMLDLNTVITTKNLEYYIQHQENEVIEMLRTVMLNVKEKSENHTLSEQNFKLLKPQTMQVSFSFVNHLLKKYGYRVGHRVENCIAHSDTMGSIRASSDDARVYKRIDLDKLKEFQGEQKMLNLRVSESVRDRWGEMAKNYPGIQKSYLLSYLLDDILDQFGY